MVAVTKAICKALMAKKRWQEIHCLLCAVHNRVECENLKAWREQQDKEWEETHAKFEERREPIESDVYDHSETD